MRSARHAWPTRVRRVAVELVVDVAAQRRVVPQVLHPVLLRVVRRAVDSVDDVVRPPVMRLQAPPLPQHLLAQHLLPRQLWRRRPQRPRRSARLRKPRIVCI